MTDSIPDLGERIHASLAGALGAEAQAHAASGALHMLSVAESLADRGGYDPDDLRSRGLGGLPPCGGAGVLVRAIPFGLASPGDRPLLRRSAYRAALLSGVDEGTATTAMAAAVIAADLLRFDLDTTLMRVRQTLLEEAPMLVLQRLAPLPSGTVPGEGADPGTALQTALTALDRVVGVRAAIDGVLAASPTAAVAASLAGALAGARDGMRDLDPGWVAEVPAADAAARAAAALSERNRITTAAVESAIAG